MKAKFANITEDILVHSLGEENKEIILSWILLKKNSLNLANSHIGRMSMSFRLLQKIGDTINR